MQQAEEEDQERAVGGDKKKVAVVDILFIQCGKGGGFSLPLCFKQKSFAIHCCVAPYSYLGEKRGRVGGGIPYG